MMSVTYKIVKCIGLLVHFEHIALVSKYRFKIFKNSKAQKVIAESFQETEKHYKIKINEFSFVDNYVHAYTEVNVSNNFVSCIKNPQINAELHGMISQEKFLGGVDSNSSISLIYENIIQNYIRRLAVSYELFMKNKEGHQMKLQYK